MPLKLFPRFEGYETGGRFSTACPAEAAASGQAQSIRHFATPTNHVAVANSIPLVDADPAIMKLLFISPPKNAAYPVKAPKIRPKAMASSPKIIILESQKCASELTRNSMNDRYQSKAITGFGVILRRLCQYSSSAWPPSIPFRIDELMPSGLPPSPTEIRAQR